MSNSSYLKHSMSLWYPKIDALNRIRRSFPVTTKIKRRSVVSAASAFANENQEFVIVGGGNAAGYAARSFVEHGMADGRLCIVSKEAHAPYERPALTKGYLFPLDKNPARLPGFYTCVGSGGERQTPEWYKEKGIEVDDQFRTSIPGIFAIGDVAAFPLKRYGRKARVEHVDHARRSAQHCVSTLLRSNTDRATKSYDYLPYFYSRVFEYEGSPRKVWWQFFGDNVGDTVVEVGNFDPKIATFWIDSGRLKGVFVESGSPEEFKLLPRIADLQPAGDKARLEETSSVEEALQLIEASI